MSRAGQLLRRFALPPEATSAELRSAYYRRAKEIHPDVAGKAGEEEFRRLKESYEEAMRLLREAEANPQKAARGGGSEYGRAQASGARAQYGWQANGYDWNAHYQQEQRHWQQYQYQRQAYQAPPEPVVEWTPAQRLRNVLLGAGGVMGVTVLYTGTSSSSSNQFAFGDAQRAQLDPASLATTSAVSRKSSPRVASPQPVREVSDYYKSRTAKSTVRVRGSDAYVSPSAPAKSRSNEEGLGSSVAAAARVAQGHSPWEAAPASPPSAEAAAAQTAAAEASRGPSVAPSPPTAASVGSAASAPADYIDLRPQSATGTGTVGAPVARAGPPEPAVVSGLVADATSCVNAASPSPSPSL